MAVFVSVDDLQPGAVLAQSVMKNFNILLSKGHRLTDRSIKILMQQCPDIPILIEEEVLDDDIRVHETERQNETITPEMSQPLRKTLETITQKANTLVRQNVNLQREHIRELEAIITEMLDFIRDNPLTLNILEQSVYWHEYLQSHGMHVLNFSLLLAYRLQDYARQKTQQENTHDLDYSSKSLTSLATAALFHDLGMTPIQHLYDKTGPLNEKEIASIKAHPLVSVKLLPDDINPITRLGILHHHENYDGSGYREGLSNQEISVLGRILRITDSYSAAISYKKYRSPKPPVVVLHEMMFGDCRNHCDPYLLQIFASALRPLPIGAKIKLNTHQWGVVVDLHPANPFNPKIIIAFDEQGKPMPKSELSRSFYLNEREDIQVVSFGKIDLSFLNTPWPDISLNEYHTELDRILTEMFSLEPVG